MDGQPKTRAQMLPSVTFDTQFDSNTDYENKSSVDWRNDGLEFQHNFVSSVEDSECVQRINCDHDFPSSWQPARRIIIFMGMVSLACTFIVIAIILVAIVLSSSAFPSSEVPVGNEQIVYLVPHPRMIYSDRPPTILMHKDYPNIMKSHISELTQLLKAYKDKQGSIPLASSCDLRYAPTVGSSCYFPLERISDNCSAVNNFGYDSENPCVALVFNAFLGWMPQPFNTSNPKEIPEDIRSEYDPRLVYLTCRCNVTRYGNVADGSVGQTSISYSPYRGFPLHFLSSNPSSVRVPPLVMVQFLGIKPQSEVHIECSLWARNVPKSSMDGNGAGTIRFNIALL